MNASADHQDQTPPVLERLLSDFGDRLGSVRRWFQEHESEITAAIEGLIAFNAIRPELERLSERYRSTEWEFLLDRVDFATGAVLLVALDRDGTQGVERLLEAALGHSEAFGPMLQALATVELPDPHRRQLAEGLRHISRRDYVLAVPLLIVAFEGIVQLHARGAGLVEVHKGEKHRFTDRAGKSGNVGGIEDLLPIEELGFDGAFADYLRRHVYGGAGNTYRHGTAIDGYRGRALALAVALLGWLNAVAPAGQGFDPLRHLLFAITTEEWARLLQTQAQVMRRQLDRAER
jgi:hypothetical protein